MCVGVTDPAGLCLCLTTAQMKTVFNISEGRGAQQRHFYQAVVCFLIFPSLGKNSDAKHVVITECVALSSKDIEHFGHDCDAVIGYQYDL